MMELADMHPKMTHPRIILVSGKMLSGKNHVVNHIERVLSPRFDVRTFAWAAPLKEITAILASLLQERDVTVADIEANKSLYRPLLQVVGRFQRDRDPDYWVKAGLGEIGFLERAIPPQGKPIIWLNSDTRYPNELSVPGAVSIRLAVERENQLARMLRRDGKADPSVLEHESETILDETEHTSLLVKWGLAPADTMRPLFDFIIPDAPLEEVYAEVDSILGLLGLLDVSRVPQAV